MLPLELPGKRDKGVWSPTLTHKCPAKLKLSERLETAIEQKAAGVVAGDGPCTP